MLQLVDRLRIPVMMLTLDAIVNLAPEIELADRRRLIGHAVATQRLFSYFADPDPFHARRGSCEVAVNELTIQPDRLEDLCTAV